MKKVVEDYALLFYFVFTGLIVGVAFTDIDLNKLTERIAAAGTAVSLSHTAAMKAISLMGGQDDDDVV